MSRLRRSCCIFSSEKHRQAIQNLLRKLWKRPIPDLVSPPWVGKMDNIHVILDCPPYPPDTSLLSFCASLHFPRCLCMYFTIRSSIEALFSFYFVPSLGKFSLFKITWNRLIVSGVGCTPSSSARMRAQSWYWRNASLRRPWAA